MAAWRAWAWTSLGLEASAGLLLGLDGLLEMGGTRFEAGELCPERVRSRFASPVLVRPGREAGDSAVDGLELSRRCKLGANCLEALAELAQTSLAGLEATPQLVDLGLLLVAQLLGTLLELGELGLEGPHGGPVDPGAARNLGVA